MPERNTNVLEVLIRQIAQDAYVVDPERTVCRACLIPIEGLSAH
jgi:hypothetical protein